MVPPDGFKTVDRLADLKQVIPGCFQFGLDVLHTHAGDILASGKSFYDAIHASNSVATDADIAEEDVGYDSEQGDGDDEYEPSNTRSWVPMRFQHHPHAQRSLDGKVNQYTDHRYPFDIPHADGLSGLARSSSRSTSIMRKSIPWMAAPGFENCIPS